MCRVLSPERTKTLVCVSGYGFFVCHLPYLSAEIVLQAIRVPDGPGALLCDAFAHVLTRAQNKSVCIHVISLNTRERRKDEPRRAERMSVHRNQSVAQRSKEGTFELGV